MSIRTRKFTYIYDTYDEELYNWLQNMNCKYHIISKCNDELHGFIYLQQAKTESALQRHMNNEYVFSFEDNHFDMIYELKSNNDYWENGNIPRYNSEKVVQTDKLYNVIANQNQKLIDTIIGDNIKLQKKNEELQKALLEKSAIVKHTCNMTNSNNDHSKNKKITNINVFLNTECKDAITLKEFVNQLVVRDEDLECMKEFGYVESVTRLLRRSLTEYGLHERPIHCTDIKREVMHVKDQEGWKKECSGESENIDKAFRQITHIHRKKMSDVYRNVESESNVFEEKAKVMYQIASAGGTEEDKYKKKIIKNIAGDIHLSNV